MLNHIIAGQNIPDDFHAVIEVPAHSALKCEIDKNSGALFLDRLLPTPMHYPCNYGYIPQTLSEDGDPIDVLVLTPTPLLGGLVVRCRPLGVLQMHDEAGRDSKILAVPIDKVCRHYKNIENYQDLPAVLLDAIVHFFEHYKDLCHGKWVKLDTWQSLETAREEIISSVKRYQDSCS